MAKVLVPEVIDMIDNGHGEYLPAVRSGLLARLFAPESTALTRIEAKKMQALARTQANIEVLKYQVRETAEFEILAYQMAQAVEVSKHKIDVNTMVAKYRDDLRGQRERIMARMEAEVALDMETEGFIDGLGDLGLPPLQEVQHKMKARQTARKEKAKQRMHAHVHEKPTKKYPWHKD